MFYNRIKDLREDSDLTQEQLAEKLGYYTTQYSRYERGEVAIPIDFFIKLAKHYDISIDYLAGLIDTPIKLSEIKQEAKKRKNL